MRNRIVKSLLFIFILQLCSSCITKRQTELMQDIQKNYPKVGQEHYRVIPGDQLRVSVFTLDPEIAKLFAEFTPATSEINVSNYNYYSENVNNIGNFLSIHADGTINFPYVGKVYVENMTLMEVGKLLTEKLRIFDENVTVNVFLSNRYFFVLGEMGGGRISMESMSLTIYQAMALGTSIGFYGDRSKVSILRQTKDGSILKTFDIRSKDIIDSEYYYIQPNDVLYVPKSGKSFFGVVTNFSSLLGMLAFVAGVVTLAVKLF